MKGYVLLNETSGFPDLTREKLLAIAAANAAQEVELASWWERTPLEMIYADSEAAAPQEDGWILMKAVNVLDDPDALAYHTESKGRPLILMGAQILRANAPAGTDWVTGPGGFSVAASHERSETTVNPYVAFYAPFDPNTWVPLEDSDPTEGDSYADKGSGVYVSNFVGPRWFSDGPGPYDRMGLITKAKEVRANGYIQKLVGGPNGASTTFWGAAYPAWKRLAKTKPGTRHSRIAARATKTDDLARCQAELVHLEEELGFHKEAGRAVAKAHDDLLDQVEQLRAEIARLVATPAPKIVRRGNGGVGG